MSPFLVLFVPVEDMLAHPYETSSDSFYFADGKLIMHNKAFYAYYVDDTTTTSTSSGTVAWIECGQSYSISTEPHPRVGCCCGGWGERVCRC